MKIKLDLPEKKIYVLAGILAVFVVLAAVYAAWPTTSPAVWHDSDSVRVIVNSLGYSVQEFANKIVAGNWDLNVVSGNIVSGGDKNIMLNPKGATIGNVVIFGSAGAKDKLCIGDPAVAANCRDAWPTGGGASGYIYARVANVRYSYDDCASDRDDGIIYDAPYYSNPSQIVNFGFESFGNIGRGWSDDPIATRIVMDMFCPAGYVAVSGGATCDVSIPTGSVPLLESRPVIVSGGDAPYVTTYNQTDCPGLGSRTYTRTTNSWGSRSAWRVKCSGSTIYAASVTCAPAS